MPGEDKTEQPTAQRLEKARREGDSGVSAYAGQAVAFVVALSLVPSVVSATAARAASLLREALRLAATRPVRVEVRGATLASDVLALVVPAVLGAAVAALAVGVVQTGGRVSVGRIAPDLAKLDPIAGISRLLSADRLFSVARALGTGAAVAWLAYRALGSRAADVARTVGRPELAAALGGSLARTVTRDAALLGLAVAALDVAVTRRSWRRRLRMSVSEVKREHRESEGDPQMKAARDRARRELLAQATLARVKEASVVVVNPTHIACALLYDEEEDSAPRVLASGEGELAARIVQAAREYGVPVLRDVPLARALRELEVGDVIPEALYEAVAEILKAAWEEDRGAG